MPQAKFQNENYYHIYNRGVEKRIVFSDKYDYIRFLESLREFNREERIGSLYIQNKIHLPCHPMPAEASDGKANQLVEIICFCLNPNHFHLLLKQKKESGISKFMHKLSMGYTNYFNAKYIRSGSLFQGKYKSVAIKTDSYLLYLFAYINANAEIHQIAKAEKWPWSSYLDYINERNGTLCNKKPILQQFKNTDEYQKFTQEIIDNSKSIKEEVKKYLLEL